MGVPLPVRWGRVLDRLGDGGGPRGEACIRVRSLVVLERVWQFLCRRVLKRVRWIVILEKLGGGIRGDGPRLPRLQSRMWLNACIVSLESLGSFIQHLVTIKWPWKPSHEIAHTHHIYTTVLLAQSFSENHLTALSNAPSFAFFATGSVTSPRTANP